MTRLFTLACLLAACLGLAALPARAEYSRDEITTFQNSRSPERATPRASNRSATRASRPTSRQARSTPRASRQATAARSNVTRRAPTRSAALPSLTGGSYQSGIASYYWQPQRVASGGWFNPNAMTAAHKTLPFGTRVRVTSLSSGRSVVVTINDRGPYIRGRIIDLSRAAAGVIGMQGSGLARVQVAILGR